MIAVTISRFSFAFVPKTPGLRFLACNIGRLLKHELIHNNHSLKTTTNYSTTTNSLSLFEHILDNNINKLIT